MKQFKSHRGLACVKFSTEQRSSPKHSIILALDGTQITVKIIYCGRSTARYIKFELRQLKYWLIYRCSWIRLPCSRSYRYTWSCLQCWYSQQAHCSLRRL